MMVEGAAKQIVGVAQRKVLDNADYHDQK